MTTQTSFKGQSIASIAPVAVGVYTWKIQEDLLYADTDVADLFGLCREDARSGMPLDRYLKSIHFEDVNRVAEAIAYALENGDAYRIEYRVISANGDVKSVLAVGQCFRDADGRPSEWAGSMMSLDSDFSAHDHEALLVSACISAYKAANNLNAAFVKYLISMALIELGQQAAADMEGEATVH